MDVTLINIDTAKINNIFSRAISKCEAAIFTNS